MTKTMSQNYENCDQRVDPTRRSNNRRHGGLFSSKPTLAPHRDIVHPQSPPASRFATYEPMYRGDLFEHESSGVKPVIPLVSLSRMYVQIDSRDPLAPELSQVPRVAETSGFNANPRRGDGARRLPHWTRGANQKLHLTPYSDPKHTLDTTEGSHVETRPRNDSGLRPALAIMDVKQKVRQHPWTMIKKVSQLEAMSTTDIGSLSLIPPAPHSLLNPRLRPVRIFESSTTSVYPQIKLIEAIRMPVLIEVPSPLKFVKKHICHELTQHASQSISMIGIIRQLRAGENNLQLCNEEQEEALAKLRDEMLGIDAGWSQVRDIDLYGGFSKGDLSHPLYPLQSPPVPLKSLRRSSETDHRHEGITATIYHIDDIDYDEPDELPPEVAVLLVIQDLPLTSHGNPLSQGNTLVPKGLDLVKVQAAKNVVKDKRHAALSQKPELANKLATEENMVDGLMEVLREDLAQSVDFFATTMSDDFERVYPSMEFQTEENGGKKKRFTLRR